MGGCKSRRPMVGSHSGAAIYVNLKIKYSPNGHEVYFNVMRNWDTRSVTDVFCDRLSLDFDDIRFVYKGHCVLAEATPDQLGMEDGDVIDAISVRPRNQFIADPGMINVSVYNSLMPSSRLHFRVNKSTILINSLVRPYCEQISVTVSGASSTHRISPPGWKNFQTVSCFAFLWEGCHIEYMTPDELKMEDRAEIEAMLHQPACKNCGKLPWNGIL